MRSPPHAQPHLAGWGQCGSQNGAGVGTAHVGAPGPGKELLVALKCCWEMESERQSCRQQPSEPRGEGASLPRHGGISLSIPLHPHEDPSSVWASLLRTQPCLRVQGRRRRKRRQPGLTFPPRRVAASPSTQPNQYAGSGGHKEPSSAVSPGVRFQSQPWLRRWVKAKQTDTVIAVCAFSSLQRVAKCAASSLVSWALIGFNEEAIKRFQFLIKGVVVQGRWGPAPFEHVGGTMGDLRTWCAVGFEGAPLLRPGWTGLCRGLWGDWRELFKAGCLWATLLALSDPAPVPLGKLQSAFLVLKPAHQRGSEQLEKAPNPKNPPKPNQALPTHSTSQKRVLDIILGGCWQGEELLWENRSLKVKVKPQCGAQKVILFYFILFYFILFYFILFYFILFYFILCQAADSHSLIETPSLWPCTASTEVGLTHPTHMYIFLAGTTLSICHNAWPGQEEWRHVVEISLGKQW